MKLQMEKNRRTKKCNKNFKTLHKSQEKCIKLFHDYPKIVSEAKYKTTYVEGLKLVN